MSTGTTVEPAGTGSVASPQTFSSGFVPALGVCAGLSLLAALAGKTFGPLTVEIHTSKKYAPRGWRRDKASLNRSGSWLAAL